MSRVIQKAFFFWINASGHLQNDWQSVFVFLLYAVADGALMRLPSTGNGIVQFSEGFLRSFKVLMNGKRCFCSGKNLSAEDRYAHLK